MDFPLNSSLILAITVGLWLLWVAPYVLRRPASVLPAVLTSVLPPPASTAIRSSISTDGLSQQGNNMMYNESTASTGTSSATSGASARGLSRTPQQPAFKIRYGRTALALAGSLALVLLVIGMPLAVFGAASWWLPAGAAAAAGAATASLRTLAVRDRRHRVEAAFRAAMTEGPRRTAAEHRPPAAAPAPAVAAAPAAYRESVLFDAESTPGTDSSGTDSSGTAGSTTAPADDRTATTVSTAPGSPGRPLTAAELREAALAVAAKTAPQAPAGPPKTSTTPWEPVEVPKPTYVEAPVAQRAAPEPILMPEVPKSTARTSIRAGAVAAAAESAASAGTEAAPATGKINLDDVLQRRRA